MGVQIVQGIKFLYVDLKNNLYRAFNILLHLKNQESTGYLLAPNKEEQNTFR